jgi:hypothetical protein
VAVRLPWTLPSWTLASWSLPGRSLLGWPRCAGASENLLNLALRSRSPAYAAVVLGVCGRVRCGPTGFT